MIDGEKKIKSLAEGVNYEELVENALDPIMVLDSLGYLRYMNATAEIMSGYSRKELLGRHFAEIGVVAPASLPKAITEFSQTMSGKPGPPYRLDMVRKDRKVLVMEVNHKPVMHDGTIVAISLILRYVGFH